MTGIRYFFALGPAIALIVSAIPAVKYTMTKKKYEAYSKALENKEAGLPYDQSLIES